MSQTLLISGPPGCGRTNWILNRIRSHQGACGSLRLAGYSVKDRALVRDGDIDLTWLQDQCPGLFDLADPDQALAPRAANLLALIELPQFQPPAWRAGVAGLILRTIAPGGCNRHACSNVRCRSCWPPRPHHVPGQRWRLWAGRRPISSA